ncbi:proteasome activator pa28 [Coprinopsis sp. MPI-PUGE-AT-0042]|nr:proteasome activator pa28 [Coprinopsis sp. MPI-PUGE-AT-0042]
MDRELEAKILQFHQETVKAGEDVVFRRFPEKVSLMQLGEFLKTLNDPSSTFSASNALKFSDPTVYPPSEPGHATGPVGKKRKLEEGDMSEQQSSQSEPTTTAGPRYLQTVKANEHMTQRVYGVLKKECEELAHLTDQVRLWVTLTLPRIEDGDNFGVQVLEEVLGEIQRAQESAFAIRDLSRQDHLARAKICSKLIKYPNIEDYALALKDHDEKQFYFARQHLYDLRNVYATITDMAQKNITRIRAPKNNNSEGLY